MIGALSPTWIVRVICGFTVALCAVVALGTSSASAQAVWKSSGIVVGLINFLILLLTFRSVFRRVHKVLHADGWWFPLLDGEWTGEVHSNWPRVHRMMLAARGEAPAFNTLTEELPPGQPGERTNVTAQIASNLFEILIELRIPGTNRLSRSVFVRPQWCKPSLPRLYYTYEQIDTGNVSATDAARHFGAAIVDYDTGTDELRGEYWTQRQGVRGLNTAGFITLSRTKRT